MKIVQEFKEFLKEYKITGLVVAFIMGGVVNTLVQSVVKDILMPLITSFLPAGDWETATLSVGSAVLKWGAFVSALLQFILIALVVFLLIKKVGSLEQTVQKGKEKIFGSLKKDVDSPQTKKSKTISKT